MISMEARELRLGNTVKSKLHNGLETEIWSVLSHGKIKLSANPVAIYDISEIEPIPLTEDWFERFGFKRTVCGFELKNIGVTLITQELYLINKYGIYTFNSVVNSVHKLQNLYFALTGEELTLKTE